MNIEKLEGHLSSLQDRFQEVGLLITDPEVLADEKRYVQLSKEYKHLQDLSNEYEKYQQAKQGIAEAEEIIAHEKDLEMKQLAEEELQQYKASLPILEERIALLLLPQDPNDDRNAIMEIRAGTGGDEAALFARDLFKMYSYYIESKGWKMSVTDFAEGSLGGYKEVVFTIEGDGVYGQLKYESGVHRVQRVPTTETQGRIHTSAATVAVFPEAEEFDVEIKDSDLRIDTYCSSGAGGQSVNTTYSAVRIVHIPTGIMVQCQDERSQLKNKAKAMAELRTRIYDMERQKIEEEKAMSRRTMVSTGDRSAKIRTYNFPQGRVTDHRIGLTLHNLPAVLGGEIQPIIDALALEENSSRLQEASLLG